MLRMITYVQIDKIVGDVLIVVILNSHTKNVSVGIGCVKNAQLLINQDWYVENVIMKNEFIFTQVWIMIL